MKAGYAFSRTRLVTLVAGATVSLAPAVAFGAVAYPPNQIVADRGTWLPFVPPPAQPAGICMVDSGVDLNPSTQPEVIYREALDGGDPGDTSPIEHGTLMAMEAAAPPSGWGASGAAPTAVRIVSIRAESATNVLTVSAYKQAINRCQAIAAVYNIKAISLSVGFQSQPNSEQLAQLTDATVAVHDYGLDVVAAAGDEGSSTVSYPAALPSVIAVGASGQDRARCAFSNTGPQVSLLAPGCGLQEANPESGELLEGYAGTSQATATTAAVLAALRAYRPGLGPSEAEQLLTSTARAAGGSLDVTALFQAAGLESVIEAGERREPVPASSDPAPVSTPAPSQPRGGAVRRVLRLPLPRVRLRHQGDTLSVRFLNMPAEGKAILSVVGADHRSVLRRMTTHDAKVRLRMRARAAVDISYVPLKQGEISASPTKVIAL